MTGEQWQGVLVSYEDCVDGGYAWFIDPHQKIFAGVENSKNNNGQQTQIMFTLEKDTLKHVMTGELNADGSFHYWRTIVAPGYLGGKKSGNLIYQRAQIKGQFNKGKITGTLYLHYNGPFSGCGGTFQLTKS